MTARLITLLVVVSSTWAQPSGKHWVTTWSTAQPLIRNQPPAPRPAAQNGQSAPTPVRPANPAHALARGFHDQTVRMIVHTSIGGSALRIKLSNPFGGTRVTIGAAHVALRAKDSDIVPASDHALSFNGKPGCTLGPGTVIFSDSLDMTVSSQTDLAVSLYLPGDTGPPSAHNGLHTSYVSKEGDLTAAPTIADAIAAANYYWLAGVDVLAPITASAVVAYAKCLRTTMRTR